MESECRGHPDEGNSMGVTTYCDGSCRKAFNIGLNKAAEIRTQRALKRIEAAQHTLSAACADLSAICGASPEWKRTAKLSESCHELWRKIAYRDRSKWRVDSMHEFECVP